MKPLSLFLLAVSFALGCRSSNRQSIHDEHPLLRTISELDGYSAWSLLADDPFPVDPDTFYACVVVQETVQESLRRGPHFAIEVSVRANESAVRGLELSGEFPVGSIFVKEKYTSEFGDRSSIHFDGLAAMIKKPAGFDPAGGNWQYVYYDSDSKTVTRGALADCSRCHEEAERDHVFANYLDR